MEIPKKFDLEELVTFRLSRLGDSLERAAVQAYERDYDLNLTEWRTLAILSQHEPTTAQDISRRSRIDKGWISRSIAKLERRGLLVRSPNSNDNRSVLLSLTEAGRALVAEIAPLSRRRHERMLAALPPDQRDAFVRALDAIQVEVDKMIDEG